MKDTILLPIPAHLVDDVAAALRLGCWVWAPEREHPILGLRDELLHLKETRA